MDSTDKFLAMEDAKTAASRVLAAFARAVAAGWSVEEVTAQMMERVKDDAQEMVQHAQSGVACIDFVGVSALFRIPEKTTPRGRGRRAKGKPPAEEVKP